MIKIAVDGLGSDEAPKPEILGVEKALEENPELNIILIGKKELFPISLLKEKFSERIEFLECESTTLSFDSPVELLKRKLNNSIVSAVSLMKENKVSAVVSAGDTGALLVIALKFLGTLEGILRPAIGILLPTQMGFSLLIDAGANPTVKPINLWQFGILGSLTYELLFKKANPTIGLLNIGKEENKGTELYQQSYNLLKNSPLNFIGNIEGCDIFKGVVDVIVCDGFVGNILLKFGEGIVETLNQALKNYLSSETKYRMRRWFSKPVLEEFIEKLNYEEQGGGILLGINGTIVVAHGRSNERAIKNAIQTAAFFAQSNLVSFLKENLPFYLNIKNGN
ncbi:MAG: phosphate acyltransferase PlsX [candidate division WOR-3 bacterium]|nr:phosphate acyltransferase PlsX [candidate division WOR-3 bacterium]MCX7837234.1 phosphate acyltransferase PlsX [candidate division WOR-3 bacterium]MDW8113431.1 phosphate acyltransferase PlsX [candidate division WOR-3 bacterium]